ncbi:hypothetical protein NSK_001686 [Nannochloropsis salina CCMP1776]|uniref:Tyrosine specific protein phosphatases domain-containing protein n=1 Tax=Nannochloropsis salina CCMP1776 TaxID=1027361 RepID=A0A4D9D8M0_9STRA|nr:hypothetical protein NSK_001686 [Nannochloropsis salina CCMP1776]|eukprot:TFJ87354.1 hypothetical protein NSK_001686 [Nannochloropsis salina CCMP1776]
MAPPQSAPKHFYSSVPQPSAMAVLAGKPTFLAWGKLRFLLMDAPRDCNLSHYIREAKHHNVIALVRVCAPTYDTEEVEAAGIQVLDMGYDDGSSPPQDVIDRWLALVDDVFSKPARLTPSLSPAASYPGIQSGKSGVALARSMSWRENSHQGAAAASPQELEETEELAPTIAVHCVAGLGRAPVLVALALIEHGFGDASAVVEFIRSKRRGAINMRQLNYLEQYQKREAVSCGGCSIM